MTFLITEPCIDVMDKSCVEQCPVDCIYEGDNMMLIHPDECIDCGACEMTCPVEAIFHEEDVPEKWVSFASVNRDFFQDIGRPGGAGKLRKAQAQQSG